MKPETRVDPAKLQTFIDSHRADFESKLGQLVEIRR
jgi:hypothetical protein